MRNGRAYVEPFPWHGPSIGPVITTNEDVRYLDERIYAAESTRIRDASGNLDLPHTYQAILENAQLRLPLKRQHSYILNIRVPERPRIKLVSDEQMRGLDEYRWEDVLALRKKEETESQERKKKRKGWSNDFLFK